MCHPKAWGFASAQTKIKCAMRQINVAITA